MICGSCRKPYFFISEKHPELAGKCENCGHEAPFVLPSYDSYHDENYTSRSYNRNQKTDPQMRGIIRALDINQDDKVVELGCGVGDYAKELSAITNHYQGYDLSIDSASLHVPDVKLAAIDLNQPLPIETESVDKIVSVHVIEHLVNWEGFVEECYRILKPSGVVAIATANRDFILHDYHYDPTHTTEWSLRDYEKLFTPYFETVENKKDCAMFNYYPINWLLRILLKPNLTYIGKKSGT